MNRGNSPLHAVRSFLSRFGKMHLILPMSFLNAAAYSGVGLGMVFFLKDNFGASASVIGLATALQWACYLAGNFGMRPVSRTLLPRHSLIISSATMAALTFIASRAQHVGATVAAFAGMGFALGLFWPPIMGWLSAGAEGAHLSRRISKFNLSWSIGIIAGPYLAGRLTEFDPRFALYAGASGFGLVAIIIVVAVFAVKSIRSDTHRDAGRPVRSSPERVVDDSTPLRYPAWIGAAGAYTVMGVLIVVFPLFARDELGLREGVIGTLLLSRGLASTVGFLIIGRTTAWQFGKAPIAIPVAVMIVLSGAMAIGQSLTAFAVLIPLVGLVVAGSYTASVFHGVAGSRERARRMGVHEAMLTIGVMIGSLGGGALYQNSGMTAVFVACVALLVAVLAVQVAFLLRR